MSEQLVRALRREMLEVASDLDELLDWMFEEHTESAQALEAYPDRIRQAVYGSVNEDSE